MTGGQVSRVDPESTGLNPVWRDSLVFTALGTGWKDGANSTEIEAVRQVLIRDMKILEGIAPESGAYLNEVRTPRLSMMPRLRSFLLPVARRLRDTSSTGRNRSSEPTTTSSWQSSVNTIRNPCSLFMKVSGRTSGTQISFAKSEKVSNPPQALALRRVRVGCGLRRSLLAIHDIA